MWQGKMPCPPTTQGQSKHTEQAWFELVLPARRFRGVGLRSCDWHDFLGACGMQTDMDMSWLPG